MAWASTHGNECVSVCFGKQDFSPAERGKRIRSLVKKWLESLEDGIPRELEDALQHGVNAVQFETFSRRIVERYKNSSLTVHFHLSELRGEPSIESHSNVTELCAVAQFFVPQERDEKRELLVKPFEFDFASDGSGQMETFVLVDIMEFVEHRERLIPSMVRLQSLDQCHSLFGNPIKPMALPSGGEVIGSTTNGECGAVSQFIRRVAQDEAVNYVVERTADVEEKIADDTSENIRRFRQGHAKNNQIALRVFLSENVAIAVSESAKNVEYRIQMFLCPDEFESGAPQRGLGEGNHVADSSTGGVG